LLKTLCKFFIVDTGLCDILVKGAIMDTAQQHLISASIDMPDICSILSVFVGSGRHLYLVSQDCCQGVGYVAEVVELGKI
jgi:hypothetical protein